MSEHESVKKSCPECGAELDANAPDQPCAACLMKLGLESWASQKDSGSGLGPTRLTGPQFEPPTPEELTGNLPNLEVLELLGLGGMGAVYKARQTSLDRVVALKLIRPDAAEVTDFAERFTREARALAKLNHPNIVTVHDFGEVDGLYFLTMEFVEGTNLQQLIEGGEFEPQQALAIIPSICEALQYAHDAGIIHRDIKPANILIDGSGRVKIADFGLARLIGSDVSAFTLTGTRQVMGTPRYMAPEQMEGSHDVDHRADIYSLGVVFYEMLTGEIPLGHFEPPSKKVEVDLRLDEVVLRSLAREPERRYQQVSEIKTDVEAVTHGEPLVQQSRAAGSQASGGRRDTDGPDKGSLVTTARTAAHRDLTHMNWSLLPFAVVLGVTLLMWLGEGIPWNPDRLRRETFEIWIPVTLVLAGIAVTVFLLYRTGYRTTQFEWKLVASVLLMVIALFGVSAAVHMGGGGDAFVSLVAVVLGIFALVYAVLLIGQMMRWSELRDVMQPVMRTRGDSTAGWLLMYLLLLSGPAIASILMVASGTDSRPNLVAAVPNTPEPVPWLMPPEPIVSAAPAPAFKPEVVATRPAEVSPNSIDRVKELIASGNPNAKNADGMTPLMTAADAGEWRATGLLLVFGGMPDLQDKTGRTALMHAIENDISEERQKGRTAEIMLSFGRLNPMHRDAYELIKADAREVFDSIAPETRGQGKIVVDLIRHDLDLQDVDGETALIKAVEQGDMKIVRLLIEDGANAGLKDRLGRTSHSIAQQEGHDAMAAYLAKAQPELHAAALVGDMARMRELLAFDVPVDGEDVNGRTPLMLASANGQLRAMLLLIMNGANEREKDTRHRTPLMHAAEAGQHRAVELLGDLMILSFRDEVQARFERLDQELFAGVDFAAMKFDVGFDVLDQSGETALMKAARGGHIEAVHMLVRRDDGRRDANQELQDHQERTALAHAILANRREFLKAMVTTRTEPHSTSATSWVSLPTLMSVDVLLLEDSQGHNGLQLLESHDFDDIAQQLRNKLRAARDELTENIEAGESDNPSLLFRWRSPLWRLFGDTEKAESDLAEAER